MELTKYKSTEVFSHIRHDLRQLPKGKSYGNESVDSSLTKENYSLIDRGKTAKEINQYRKDFESQLFKYNRKDLVHAVELVIQCPSDCPPEQHKAFFQTAFDWYCDKYLPAGKDCVFVAEVHKDEHKYITTIENGVEVQKDISKEHLHIAYVPAVPAGKKHPDFEYRLNADALTRKSILKDMHPSLQAELDAKGITATVYQKKSGDGKTIPLTVKQLKEITNKTGLVIDHTLTVEEFSEILSKNVELSKDFEKLSATVTAQQKDIADLTIAASQKDRQLEDMQKQLDKLQEAYKAQTAELHRSQEKAAELEKTRTTSASHNERTWGADSSWGAPSGWGSTDKTHTTEEERLW